MKLYCINRTIPVITEPFEQPTYTMRPPAPTANKQRIVQPEQKYFLTPKADNLRHAAVRKTLRFGEVSIMILAARSRNTAKRDHFGLAGFHLN